MRENSALVTAVRKGDLADAADRLRAGVDFDAPDPEGLTPLMIASGRGQAQMVELLLTAGAEVHLVDSRAGAAALHKAALSGNPDVVSLLLDRGAFIDQQCPILGHTALHDAVVYKAEMVVRLLLSRGARTSIRNHSQETPLDLARRDKLDALAQLIAAKDKASEDQISAHPLVAAIAAGDLGKVRQLVCEGADIDVRLPMVGSPDDNYTPLAIAAREGHAEIVRSLLEAGANPRRVIGLFLGTSMHEACYFGHGDVIEVMLNGHERDDIRPSELDAQGALNGFTPLHDAVWHGHLEAARILVGEGARLDLVSHAGLTPRQLAVRYGYGELARLLADAERTSGSSSPVFAEASERAS